MEKGEIAHFEQFHRFPTMFSYSFFLLCVKMSMYAEMVNCMAFNAAFNII